MGKALITESILTDTANAIRSKLGVQTQYKPGQMAAAILSIPTYPEPTGTVAITTNGSHDVKDFETANVNVPGSHLVFGIITENGTFSPDNADGYFSVDVDVTPNLQSKTVTQNGTVTADSGYDGLSQVVVNVSGGGGVNVLQGDDVPSASIGQNGDYYIRSGSANVYIRIDISKVARGTNTNFSYYGSRAISIVCKDENDNEVEISPNIAEQYYWIGSSLVPRGSNRGVFRAEIGNYIENNGLPAHYAAKYSIPTAYTIHKIRLTRRDSATYQDYWVTFNVYQCDSSGNNLSLLLSEENLTSSDWNDWNSFTDFTPTGQLVPPASLHEVYEKQNGAWVAI